MKTKRIIFVLLLGLAFLLLASQLSLFIPNVKASPAHTFDTKYQGAKANTNPYTFSYTCGAGTTLFVLSIVVGSTTARAGGAPTYNGVVMAQADQTRKSTETFAELWYLLSPPTGSSYTCSIPNTGTAKYLSPVASSYKAASGYASALRTANGGTGRSTNPTGPTLTGLASGDVIIAVVGTGATTWAPTARTGTQLYDRDDGTYGNGAQYLIKTDANDVAMGWTFGTSDDWAICEAAFKENNIPSNGAPSGTNWDDTDNCYAQKQWYQAVVVYTDLDGYADFTYVELYLQTGTPVTRAQFRYTEDTNTASVQTGGTSWDFDTTASNFVRSGNTITATWKFMPQWDAIEESDLDFKLYSIDSGTASDTDTIDVNFDVVTNLLVSTIECTNTNNPDRININTATQIDVTVLYANAPASSTPTTFYPPDAEFTSIAIHDSSHNLKGTDTSIVNGVGNVAITSETTVQSMNYHAYINMADADYTDGDESPTETIISDRLQVQSYTVSDSRADINANVTIDALVWFDYDNTVCTTGTITINGYSASHIGSGVYRITRTSASVTSVAYNTVACSAETTYGITTVDQNSQSTTVVWDRIRIDSLSAVDSRVDINTQILFYATASLEFDSHPLGSGDSFTLSGYAFVWSAGNNRFEVTETKTTVTSVTINAFTSGSEATYGITSGNINSKTITGIWDRFEFVSVSADDTRINVGGTFELRYQIRYDFDDVTFNSSKGSITGFVWDSVNSWWDKTVIGSSSVTSTNYDETYISITDSTYGLTVKQDVAGTDVITDRIRIDTLSAIDTRIDISAQGTFYATASLEYDSHALGSGDSLTLSSYVFSWSVGNSSWENSTTQASVTSITINSFTSGNEATYGITVGIINSNTATIIWDRIEIYEKDEPIIGQALKTEPLYSDTPSILPFPMFVLSLLLLLSFIKYKRNKRSKILCSILVFLLLVPFLCLTKPVLASDQSVPVNTYVIIWFKARYDYDNASYTNQSSSILSINGTLATYNATGDYWQLNVTQSVVGNYTYFVSAISDGVYGLTVISDVVGGITIEFTPPGYNLNLRVMDYDLTDAISDALVYKDSDVKTSDSNGWANWTLVSGTVQIKVRYHGFWVNGTFSVTMDSDKTINVQCKLYDVTVLVQEGVQNASLASANVTVYNSTSVQGNKITSGLTGNNGQVQLLNLPNNTLTFTQYGGASYSLVIGNTTQLVSSENQTITLTADQNNINTNNNYSIIAFAGMTIPFKSSFVTNRLKKKMQKRSETNEDSSEEVLS